MRNTPPIPVWKTLRDAVVLAAFLAVILAVGGAAQLVTGGHW